MVKMAWKVYGENGKPQELSFKPSEKMDFSEPGEPLKIEIWNADKTGTNDYSIVFITCRYEGDCINEFYAQLYDGIFENYPHGKIEYFLDY